jgi:hypothetical protein
MSMKNETKRGSQAPAETPAAAKPPRRVTALAELEAVCGGSFTVRLNVRGEELEVAGRRLMPDESRQVKLKLESVLPPLLPPEKEGEEPRYDFRSLKYLEQVETARREARAIALWWAYLLFREKAVEETRNPKPEIRKAEEWSVTEITNFIEHLPLDDDVLDLLFAAVTHGVVGKEAYVGFSSGSSSAKS